MVTLDTVKAEARAELIARYEPGSTGKVVMIYHKDDAPERFLIQHPELELCLYRYAKSVKAPFVVTVEWGARTLAGDDEVDIIGSYRVVDRVNDVTSFAHVTPEEEAA